MGNRNNEKEYYFFQNSSPVGGSNAYKLPTTIKTQRKGSGKRWKNYFVSSVISLVLSQL